MNAKKTQKNTRPKNTSQGRREANKERFDVIVIGGGLAGMTLTALLAHSGLTTLCLERDKPQAMLAGDFDGRTTAISYGSHKILQKAGLWDALAEKACPIEDIRILDDGSPVLLDFLAADIKASAFGWILENLDIRAALYQKLLSLEHAEHVAPAEVSDFEHGADSVCVRLGDGRVFTAALIVGADGRGSLTRRKMGLGTRHWTYGQRAIVCCTAHENPHHNVAVEHFRPEGPFAILPMNDGPEGEHRSAVVWSEHGKGRGRQAVSALEADQASFDAALCARFPESYGHVRQIGRRFSYPLGFIHAHDYIAPRMALVADAAHGIHPIAGQGLNLGFRDIDVLARLLSAAKSSGRDPGAPALLAEYQRLRRPDNMAMAFATDSLNRLFSNRVPPVRFLRRMGLRAVEKCPPAKRFFMRQAMGLGAGTKNISSPELADIAGHTRR